MSRVWQLQVTPGLSIFLEQVSKATNMCNHVIISGDANIDTNKYEDPSYYLKPLSDKYQSETASLGLKQLSLGKTFLAHRLDKHGRPITSDIDHQRRQKDANKTAKKCN